MKCSDLIVRGQPLNDLLERGAEYPSFSLAFVYRSISQTEQVLRSLINDERFDALFTQAAVKESLHRREFATVALEFEPQVMAFNDDYEIRATDRRGRSFVSLVPDGGRQKLFVL